ncbi:MAG: hypothetical protein II786_00905 [Muribaculaceae bacterium]|nr:hypothetical protein [Muribaculaceae bacterium]
MDNKQQHTSTRWWYWAGLAVAGIIFWIFNVFTPLKGDDITYLFVEGNTSVPVSDLSTLWQSMVYHYIDTNGRLSDMIAKVFLGLTGKGVFNVVNAAVFVLFLHLVCHLAQARRQGMTLALSCLFVLLFFPYPGETLMWLSGSCNYLWSATLTLALLALLQWLPSHRHGVMMHVGAALLGFVAGAMNESVSLAAAVGLAIYYVLHPRQWRGAVITASVTYLLGIGMILVSPSFIGRVNNGEVVMDVGWRQIVSRRAINTFLKTGHYVTPFLAMLVIAYTWVRRGWHAVADSMVNWVFVGAFLTVVAMSLTKPRAYTAYSVFGFLVVAQWLAQMLTDKPRVRRWLAVALALACVYPALRAGHAIVDYKRFNDRVEAEIAAAPQQAIVAATQWQGDTRWVAPSFYDSYVYCSYANAYSHYYGKDNVQFVRPAVMERYRSGNFLAGSTPLHFASNRPDLAHGIVGWENEEFSAIVVDTNLVKREFDLITIDIASQEDRLSTEQAQKRRQWGVLKNTQQWYFYWLRQGDSCLVMLPHLPDDVLAVTVPLMEADTTVRVLFTRTAPDSLSLPPSW